MLQDSRDSFMRRIRGFREVLLVIIHEYKNRLQPSEYGVAAICSNIQG